MELIMNTTTFSSNILIVDDTSEHLYHAGNILRPLGYPIRIALTGHRALELIQEQKPTVILLDILLDDMDGFQICRQLKSNPDYADIAVIFVTGLNDDESIQEGFRVGAQDYVTKPYRPAELIARIQNQIHLATQAAELKSAYEELDHFCQNVSHDLKSPLLVIQQLASLLVRSVPNQDDSDIATITELLDSNCQHALTMVERLLELSHISQMPLKKSHVSLRHLIQETITELTLLEPERKFDISIDNDLPYLNGDRELLKILFQNVLNNAIKFTRNRSLAEIKVSSSTTTSSFILCVRDNGAGFDSKHTDKLFQVFSRLHASSEFEGSGVGLTIVAKIMKMHGGTARITGETDKGAAIFLHFPIQLILQ